MEDEGKEPHIVTAIIRPGFVEFNGNVAWRDGSALLKRAQRSSSSAVSLFVALSAVVVMMLTSLAAAAAATAVRSPSAMSDQKISALMTRTNERRTEKEISRMLNVHQFSVWVDQLSEARPDLALIYLPSSPIRS